MTRLLKILRTVLWGTVVVLLVGVAVAAWLPESTTATVRGGDVEWRHLNPTTTTTVVRGRVGQAAVGLSGPAGAPMVDVHATGTLPAGAQVRKALGTVSIPDPFDGLEGTVTTITVAAIAVTVLLGLTLITIIVRSPR